MLPARKRALVLGGGADEGEGGCVPYEGVCVIYRISPCRGRVWDRAFAVVALASWVRSRQSRFSLFILGSHSLPPGGVAFSSSPFALRCDAYLFHLVVFLGCIRLDGEPVPGRSRPVSDGNLLSRCARAMLELWFSKPARTRADAHPQTKNALHQQARARGMDSWTRHA